MQTSFSDLQLADPATAVSAAIIRKCVHCGFCLATCPTYLLLGDELDSPRGRIYLMKDMLENDREPTPELVRHVDRCLSCLSCMTTCPSGVNYMHLVDHARNYIEQRYTRPLSERIIRALLAFLLPHPSRFRFALRLARLARPIASLLGKVPGCQPLSAMLKLAPARAVTSATRIASPRVGVVRRGRVALLQGCAEPVLRPEICSAAVRLLNRAGYDVIFAAGEACCGALVHHMGRENAALVAARRNVDAWTGEIERGGLDAVVITASGCGTTIKNYGFMLRAEAEYSTKAARVSALAQDISELLQGSALPPGDGHGLTVAYHAACSLQHGQQITAPVQLLLAAGYVVRTPAEAHLCCGSAGTYNILQPQIASQLGDRKMASIERLKPDVVATSNIGCAMQLAQRTSVPVVHTIELLDWATGGPMPPALSSSLKTTESDA
jgi:glycolate oxidase iron-sulfur subunit